MARGVQYSVAVVVVSAALLLAGCGGESTTSAPTPAPTPAPTMAPLPRADMSKVWPAFLDEIHWWRNMSEGRLNTTAVAQFFPTKEQEEGGVLPSEPCRWAVRQPNLFAGGRCDRESIAASFGWGSERASGHLLGTAREGARVVNRVFDTLIDIDNGSYYVGFNLVSGTTPRNHKAWTSHMFAWTDSGLIFGFFMHDYYVEFLNQDIDTSTFAHEPSQIEERFLSSADNQEVASQDADTSWLSCPVAAALNNTWAENNKSAFLRLFTTDAQVFLSMNEDSDTSTFTYEPSQIEDFWDKVFVANPFIGNETSNEARCLRAAYVLAPGFEAAFVWLLAAAAVEINFNFLVVKKQPNDEPLIRQMVVQVHPKSWPLFP